MVKLACSIEDDRHYFTGVLNGAGGHSTKEENIGRDNDIGGVTLAGKDEESEGFLGREEGRRDGGAR